MNAKVEEVPREVIEGKLLAALDDKECVAILANKRDLNDFIDAFCTSPIRSTPRGKQLIKDLIKLRDSAFS